jgi:hypothetical protein
MLEALVVMAQLPMVLLVLVVQVRHIRQAQPILAAQVVFMMVFQRQTEALVSLSSAIQTHS